jgi:hypothetical protein
MGLDIGGSYAFAALQCNNYKNINIKTFININIMGLDIGGSTIQ